jgi:hypothetical protein
MASDNETQTPQRQPRLWLVTVRVLVVVAMLFTAVGASGIFAFQLCPGCPPRMPDPEIHQQLPEELEKDTKSTK